MSVNPKVSIVIPVYNGSNYLKEAIDSALAQTYKDIEVIVVNDGSIDDGKTEAIAISYGKKIHYFAKENGGVATALNLGIQKAEGEYLSWLSHDDIYYPHKIEHQVDIYKKINRDIILYSNYDVIDENSKIIFTVNHSYIEPKNFRYLLIVSSPIHGCTALIQKSHFDKYGLFNESLKTTQDYDMWFRLSEKIEFVHITDSLIQSRHHKNQGTHTLKKRHIIECDNLLIDFLQSISDEDIYTNTKKPLALSYAKIAENLFKRNFLKAARFAADCAIAKLHSSTLNNRLLALILIYRIRLIIFYRKLYSLS